MVTAELKQIFLVKNGDEIDLSQNVGLCVFGEDISQKLVNGQLTFRDEFKIFNLIEFVGDEKIKIIIHDFLSNEDVTYEFRYISHTINSVPSAPSQEITISFTEVSYPLFIKEFSIFIDNEPISDFVSRFSNNILKKKIDILEQSKGKYSLAFPYQKFHYMLSYLNQYLNSVKGNTNYFYFSTLNATFFSTLQNLLILPKDYMYFQEVSKDNNGIDLGLSSFTNYEIEKIPDIYQTLLEKQCSSKLQYYDYSTGKMVEKSVKFSDVVKDEKMLGNVSALTKTLLDDYMYVYYGSTLNNKNKEMIQQGLYNNGSDILSISIGGNLRRCAGLTCNVSFMEKNIGSENIEVGRSGIYLVTKLTHIFTRNDYKQKLYILKNAKNYPSSEFQAVTDKAVLNK